MAPDAHCSGGGGGAAGAGAAEPQDWGDDDEQRVQPLALGVHRGGGVQDLVDLAGTRLTTARCTQNNGPLL
jgi:hypothetical protein